MQWRRVPKDQPVADLFLDNPRVNVHFHGAAIFSLATQHGASVDSCARCPRFCLCSPRRPCLDGPFAVAILEDWQQRGCHARPPNGRRGGEPQGFRGYSQLPLGSGQVRTDLSSSASSQSTETPPCAAVVAWTRHEKQCYRKGAGESCNAVKLADLRLVAGLTCVCCVPAGRRAASGSGLLTWSQHTENCTAECCEKRRLQSLGNE